MDLRSIIKGCVTFIDAVKSGIQPRNKANVWDKVAPSKRGACKRSCQIPMWGNAELLAGAVSITKIQIKS